MLFLLNDFSWPCSPDFCSSFSSIYFSVDCRRYLQQFPVCSLEWVIPAGSITSGFLGRVRQSSMYVPVCSCLFLSKFWSWTCAGLPLAGKLDRNDPAPCYLSCSSLLLQLLAYHICSQDSGTILSACPTLHSPMKHQPCTSPPPCFKSAKLQPPGQWLVGGPPRRRFAGCPETDIDPGEAGLVPLPHQLVPPASSCGASAPAASVS